MLVSERSAEGPEVCLTQSEAQSAHQAEQKQLPDLLKALLQCADTTALRQLLPQQPPGGQVHPCINLRHNHIHLAVKPAQLDLTTIM